jgi:hypothetical protein
LYKTRAFCLQKELARSDKKLEVKSAVEKRITNIAGKMLPGINHKIKAKPKNRK